MDDRAQYSEVRQMIIDMLRMDLLGPTEENEILSDMRGISANKTAIFVSHSMSSCKWADKIIVMKDGCVEEIGRHEELMSRQGEYEKLFSMQASFYA